MNREIDDFISIRFWFSKDDSLIDREGDHNINGSENI